MCFKCLFSSAKQLVFVSIFIIHIHIYILLLLFFADGNNSYLEETEQNNRNLRCDSPEDDFDSLLKMARQDIKRNRSPTPEWT